MVRAVTPNRTILLERPRRILVYAFLAVSLWYLLWRLGTFNPHAKVLSMVIYAAEVYGFITAMEGDVVWVEIAEGVEVRVAKGAIARRVDPTTTPTEAPADGTPITDTPPPLPESTDAPHPSDDEQ